jgi:thiazole/oxazole-forming peptide maturase SagD family component
MRLVSGYSGGNLNHFTRALSRRMVSPLCGLDQRVSFLLRGRLEPRLVIAGAEMTGVHVLAGRPAPRSGSYHIGGGGFFLHEALLRTLAETAERYGQLVSERTFADRLVFETHETLVRRGAPAMEERALNVFSDQQFLRPGFPFRPFRRDAPVSWVAGNSLLENGESLLVPAQTVFVGYTVREDEGEVLFYPAFTTGTAAHTIPREALNNALLELVQIDAAMGHWYSDARAPQIRLDERTSTISSMIARLFDSRRTVVEFYLLRSPDFSVFSVCCLVKDPGGRIPTLAVGLGCELGLTEAMYRAMLEAAGVLQLAKMVCLQINWGEEYGSSAIEPGAIYDLDRNVAYYASGEGAAIIEEKFVFKECLGSSELPKDVVGSPEERNELLIRSFRESGKKLIGFDLTTDDVRELGLHVVRVWSPDTLSLSLPSAPPQRHPRFVAYGGFHNAGPHPYP